MAKNKPHFLVYGRTLKGDHWKKIGVGWRSRTRNEKQLGYVRVVLDFMPTTGELTIWDAKDREIDLEPADEQVDSRVDLVPTLVEEAD